MKKFTFALLSLLLLIGCGSEKKQNGIPIVDVTKNYPTKEFVIQDIADVEYVPLETRDDVLLDGSTFKYTISPDSLLVGNYKEGTIFLFNGKGKLINKFKHKGASGREYKNVFGLFYDKKTKEITVLDYLMNNKMLVFDINGNYKRTLPLPKEQSFMSNDIADYNDEAFLCHKSGMSFGFFGINTADSLKNKPFQPFALLSKKDGKIISYLPIKIKQRVETNVIHKDKEKNSIFIQTANIHAINKSNNTIICGDASQDTIFTYTNKQFKPLVIRTPEVASMTNPSFLEIRKITPKYLFGKIIDKRPKEKEVFPERNIAINRATNEVFVCNIKNKDIDKKKLSSEWIFKNNFLLSVDDLKEMLEEGKLKGKLKIIAENLKDDDNPVWVKVKMK